MRVKEWEREVWLGDEVERNRLSVSLPVCLLRQVLLYNVWGLIKSSVRLRRAEKEEAAAEKEMRWRFAEALTLFYILKLMQSNKHCHHSSSPPFLCVCVFVWNTHTHTCVPPLCPCKCCSKMSPLSSHQRLRCYESEGLLPYLNLQMFSLLWDLTHCASPPATCRWWPREKTAEDTTTSSPTWWELATWNNPTQKTAITQLSVMQCSA